MDIIIILYKEQLYRFTVESGRNYVVGPDFNDDLIIRNMTRGKVYLSFSNGVMLVQGTGDLSCSKQVEKGVLKRVVSEPRLSFLWRDYDGNCYEEYFLQEGETVTVGRGGDNTIELANELVSRHHLTMKMSQGRLDVMDGWKGQPSSNGIYVNGTSVSTAVLKDQDYIDIMHIRILFTNGRLHFDNVGSNYRIHPQATKEEYSEQKPKKKVHSYWKRSNQEQAQERDDVTEEFHYQIPTTPPPPPGNREYYGGSGGNGTFSAYSNSEKPRDYPGQRRRMELPRKTIVLDSIQGDAPITETKAAMFGGAETDHEDAVSRPLQAAQIRIQRKKDAGPDPVEPLDDRLRKTYQRYLRSQKQRIREVADRQRNIAVTENPSPQAVLSIAERSSDMLWERSAADSDFLKVRSGIGYAPLCVPVSFEGPNERYLGTNTEYGRVLEEIREYARYVDHMPFMADLKQYSTISISGPEDRANNLLWNMVMELAVFHHPQDVKIAGILSPEQRAVFQSMNLLPHAKDTLSGTELFSFGEYGISQVNKAVRATLATGGKPGHIGPKHMVVLLGSPKIATDRAWFQELLSREDKAPVTAILLCRDKHEAPSACRYFIDLNYPVGSATANPRVVHREYFVPDMTADERDRYQFCHCLASAKKTI